MDVFSGFVLGMIGSFHCIGMCGPIALSLSYGAGRRRSFVSGRIIYNTGRIISYALMGLVFGFMGNRIILWGFQSTLSLTTGILILLFMILNLSGKRFFIEFRLLNKCSVKYKNFFGRLIRGRTRYSMLMTGILNGLLPCGFVYAALGGALLSGSLLRGVIYMIMFGAGTIPVMLGISLSGRFMSLDLRKRILKYSPAAGIIIAIIFILRGSGLGIPFVSPQISTARETVKELICH